MTIYITGASGHVGTEMVKLGCIPLGCDITDYNDICETLSHLKERPSCIINLAGYSDPDFCEKKENQEIVIKVNVRGAWNLCDAAHQEQNIPVVLLSTDHVFDGKHGPYRERAKPSPPVNFYGMSKMAMEGIGDSFENVKIVRTSYLFTYERLSADSVDTYPTFLTRSFMYLPHFAKVLFAYANHIMPMPKVLNISGSQTISWYEFALAVAEKFHIDKEKIKPRTRELKDFDGAPRPRKGGLVTTYSEKLGLPQFSFLDGLVAMKYDRVMKELYP